MGKDGNPVQEDLNDETILSARCRSKKSLLATGGRCQQSSFQV
ncbi:hypothetical protein D1BOALGB6SA_4237 [Olavius sp. associated proteobacterium Delta 1]|nr:hypothetical protein D1BOALGB6SA_4237 [Olavius sp. associated proteobacterium Delta 1]